MVNELLGKVAIVTGGASGIGAGIVEKFLSEGARVVIADVERERGEELAGKLGGDVVFRSADVSSPEQIGALVAGAVETFGRLDVMVNNAGVSSKMHRSFLDDDLADFQRVMSVNVLGVMAGTRDAARQMPSHGPENVAAILKTSLDRALRKLFPSTSKLTFNPLFRAAVNAFDVVPRPMFPEFRTLPPNHLRIRIGVGNRILNNQTHFLVHARDFWMFVFSEGIATMHSDILDIGVGCGRWAHWLRDYNFRGRQFTGTYVGVDIDEEAIAWCQNHYEEANIRA